MLVFWLLFFWQKTQQPNKTKQPLNILMAAKSVSQLSETSVDTTSYYPIEGCVSRNQGP